MYLKKLCQAELFQYNYLLLLNYLHICGNLVAGHISIQLLVTIKLFIFSTPLPSIIISIQLLVTIKHMLPVQSFLANQFQYNYLLLLNMAGADNYGKYDRFQYNYLLLLNIVDMYSVPL